MTVARTKYRLPHWGRKPVKRCWVLLVLALVAPTVQGQIPFGGPGSFSQSFDVLANTGTANPWTNNVTINSVFAFQVSGGAAVPTYRANDGTNKAADLNSFGSTGSPDRALGAIAGGSTGNIAYGYIVQNTSSSTLSFAVEYTGEQWRDGGSSSPAAEFLRFSYRTSSTLPSTYADWDPSLQLPAGYVSVPALDFASPVFVDTNNGNALNGNLAANRTVIPQTYLSVGVAPGEYLILRWFDLNETGNNHAMGIDNLTITGVVGVPEPATVLGIAGAGLAAGSWVRRRWRSAA